MKLNKELNKQLDAITPIGVSDSVRSWNRWRICIVHYEYEETVKTFLKENFNVGTFGMDYLGMVGGGVRVWDIYFKDQADLNYFKLAFVNKYS